MHTKRAELFKALAVESRIKIIELLKEKGPLCVNELAEAIGISPSAVSQHLKVLKYSGLVKDERKGYFIPYDVEVEVLEKCHEMLSHVCDCSCHEHHHKIVKIKMHKPSDKLKMLKEYETELQKELEKIQDRIEKLKENA